MRDRFLAPELAQRIRLVILDVDGVLTDGSAYIGSGPNGERLELKRFDVLDGLGIRMMIWAGLRVALISGRESSANTLRAEELGIECFQDSGARKLPALTLLMNRHGIEWEEIAFLGDDLPDLPALHRVGLPAAVANAVAEVRAVANFVTLCRGGRGAVREFAETLLRARGDWNRLVEEYCRARDAEPEPVSSGSQ